MPRVCVLALIGLPAAGKTTFSTWLCKQQKYLSNCNILHICYDDYLDVPTRNDTSYKNQRASILNLITQLVVAIKTNDNCQTFVLPMQLQQVALNSHSNDYLIICDDNHYYTSMRYKLYQLCRVQACSYAQIYLDATFATCLQRNATRKDSIPVAVLQQMQLRLEVPCVAANTWETNSLTLENWETVPSDVVCNFLKKTFATETLPATQTQQYQAPQTQTMAHNLDLKLRTCIQSKLEQTMEPTTKQKAFQTLNKRRKQILALYKVNVKTQANHVADLDYYVKLLN